MTDNDKIDFFVETMKHARSMLFESDIVYFQEKQKGKEFHSHQGIIFFECHVFAFLYVTIFTEIIFQYEILKTIFDDAFKDRIYNEIYINNDYLFNEHKDLIRYDFKTFKTLFCSRLNLYMTLKNEQPIGTYDLGSIRKDKINSYTKYAYYETYFLYYMIYKSESINQKTFNSFNNNRTKLFTTINELDNLFRFKINVNCNFAPSIIKAYNSLVQLINELKNKTEINKALSILELPLDKPLTLDLIHDQYRKLAKKYHPDAVAEEYKAEMAKRFDQLVKANEFLTANFDAINNEMHDSLTEEKMLDARTENTLMDIVKSNLDTDFTNLKQQRKETKVFLWILIVFIFLCLISGLISLFK